MAVHFILPMNYIHLSETQAIDIGNILVRYSKYIEISLNNAILRYESIDDLDIRSMIQIDIDNLQKELNLIEERCKNLGLEIKNE